MSVSSIATATCIFDRSSAIVNSVGVLRLAATVWPASTWREITTPLTGAVIDGLLEVVARGRQRRLALLDRRGGVRDLRLGRLDLRLRRAHRLGGALLDEPRLVELGRRDEALLHQRLLALEVGLRVLRR